MSVISVRPATLADLDFVRQDGYISADKARRKIEEEEVFVALREGGAIGYLRLEYLWSFIPYIALIYVRPECRRQGAGKAMLGHVEELLRARGCAALYSSSQADEPQPQAWHRHVGFAECGLLAGINPEGVGEIFFRKALR
jgi:GNAT superfamily N-acetyltransferase